MLFLQRYKLNNKIMSMQQSLTFLDVLNSTIKRNHNRNKSTTVRDRLYNKRSRFPYAKAVVFDDRQQQYNKQNLYPKWLTKRQEFLNFMYKNYEKKLMSIPKICEKTERASDQKYFVGLYLQQNPLFNKLPPVVTDLILSRIRTRYVKVGEVIHPGGVPSFLGVVFAGIVAYKQGKETITSGKNTVIMPSAFNGQPHQAIYCRQEAVILVLDVSIYETLVTCLRQDIQMRERDQISDLLKSTFFQQLHMKDKNSQKFYQNCHLKFYFDGQVIAEAGSDVSHFSIIFRGDVVQQNHIYIRQHNKWPMPYRKWQVRAVYNSYHKHHILKRFDFFGDQEITTMSKFKSKYIAKGWVILFIMDTDKFTASMGIEEVKRLKKYRNQHMDINYGEFELNIRKRVRSLSEQRNIVKKAITGSLAHRDNLTPRKMSMINNFQQTMLNKTFFEKGSQLDL